MAKTEDVKIKTRATKDAPPKETVVQYTFPENLAESTEWYGEKLCNDLIKKAIKVGAQAAGRPLLVSNKSQEEIQAAVSAFKPEEGSRRGRVKYITDIDTLKENFAAMPAAERNAMLAMFEAYVRGDVGAVVGTSSEESENGDDEDDENGDDEDEDAEPPAPTESPPPNANRAQRRPRGPQYD